MSDINIPLTNPEVLKRDLRIIGISGKARAGKDTLFAIAEKDGYTKLSFAGELKRRARQDFGLTDEHTDGSLKETPCDLLNGKTPREFLIELGNLYRKYRPTFWVDIILRRIALEAECRFMITDVRYPNEAEALKSVGGVLLRLERHPDRDSMVDEKTKQSISETALDDYPGFDFVLPGHSNEVPADLSCFWTYIMATCSYAGNVWHKCSIV